MSRPTPRRPSRTTTPKPRKIAGRAPADAPEESAPPSQASAATPPRVPPRPPRPVAKPPAGAGGGEGGGAGRTSTLLAVLGLLVLLLVLQAGWFVWNSARDVEVAADTTSAGPDDGDDPISVPSDRPVVLNQVAVQGGVDAAATAAQAMFARNWETYDEGVDSALELMTDTFAAEYSTTSDDVRREFIRKKTDVQVRVVAQGVVRANDAELEALIFLNQYTIRGDGPDARTTYTPYRALMRMVHTDRGWLVDGVDTK